VAEQPATLAAGLAFTPVDQQLLLEVARLSRRAEAVNMGKA